MSRSNRIPVKSPAIREADEAKKPSAQEALEYLTSWKEIAQYMRSGVRTVQRYERELGLPVRRPTGKSRGAVMATRAEIDAWVAAAPIHETFELSRAATNSRALAYAAKMERNMEAMGKLREQLNQLRKENRAATDLLLKKVASLHSVMPPSRAQGYEPLVGMDWTLLPETEENEDFLKTHRGSSASRNKKTH